MALSRVKRVYSDGFDALIFSELVCLLWIHTAGGVTTNAQRLTRRMEGKFTLSDHFFNADYHRGFKGYSTALHLLLNCGSVGVP